MIFIDTNIPIYTSGRPHPLRDPCIRILRLAADHPDLFFTDAEVLQELLHRFLALRRWREGRQLFYEFVNLMEDRVEAIFPADVRRASNLADRHPELEARDLLHIAVMQRVGANQIISADKGFDQMQEIERLDPANVEQWVGDIVS